MADDIPSYLPGWTPASVLMNSTGDAMDNIFDISIFWPWDSQSDSTEVAASYRAEGFDIPEPKTKTHDVTWLGVTVKRVSSGVSLERTFDLNFRLDANYALYSKFVQWQKFVIDVNTSGVANTESALGKVTVTAPGAEYNAMSWTPATKAEAADNKLSVRGNNISKLVWTFEDVAVVEVGTPKFKNQGEGKVMMYKVKFTFGDASYPFFSSTGVTENIHNHKQS